MSLSNIGFSFALHEVKSPDVVRKFVDGFLKGMVDPMSIGFTWMSTEGSDFYLYPGSLPRSPFDPDEFPSEYYPAGMNLSRLGERRRYLQFDEQQHGFISLWEEWVKKYRARPGEVSFEIWGPVNVAFLSHEGIGHDWFLMEAINVQGDVLRVPLLECDVQVHFSRDVTLFISTHSLVWTPYSRIIDASASEPNENGYVAKTLAEVDVAQENVRALAAHIRRFVDSISCSSCEWRDESEASRPDLACLLRDELTRILKRPMTS
jgi:hypothetical protein